MNLNAIYLVVTIIVGLGTIGTIGIAIARWIGRVDENTRATARLTGAFDAFTEKVGNTLLDHEKRITTLEAKGDD